MYQLNETLTNNRAAQLAKHCKKDMKDYTAIYSTEKIKGICYSFRAENAEKAIEFANWKFSSTSSMAIIECDATGDCMSGKLVFLNGEKLS